MMPRVLSALLDEAMRPQRHATRMAAFSAVAGAVAAVVLLGVSGWFITGAALAGVGGVLVVQMFNYLLPSAMIRLLAIMRTVSRYGERYFSHRAALLALAMLRTRIFGRLVNARTADAVSVSAGDATARLVQDIDALEDLIVRRPALPAALAGGAVGLVLTLLASAASAVALLIVLLLIPPVARALARRLLAGPARRVQELAGVLKHEFVEYAAASAEILAYSLEAPVRQSLEAHAARLDEARLDLARGEALLGALLTACGGVAMAAVFAQSTASLPITVLATLAAGAAVETMAAYVRSLARRESVAAGLERLSSLAGFEPAPASDHGLTGRTISLPDGDGMVQLGQGDRLAITGRSGTGKTSLLEALSGLRTDQSGRVAVDNQPVNQCSMDDLRPLFALSPQNAQMITGSIADNLRLARTGLSDDALWQALEVACFDADVRAMPAGLDSWVGDGGARLSGGQRKRLSIARALLAGRPWLLLDEPSEGLDPATERELVGRLDRWLAESGCGLIVVSHRPALWALADRRLDLS